MTDSHEATRPAARRVPLAAQLAGAFALVLAIAAAAGVFALSKETRTHQRLTALTNRTMPATVVMGELTTLANKYRKDQMHFILADPSEYADVRGDLKGDTDDLNALYKQADALLPGNRDFAAWRTSLQNYIRLSAPYAGLAARGQTAAASAALGGKADEQWDANRAATDAWQTHLAAQMKATAREADAAHSAAVHDTLLVLLGALLVGGALATLLTRRIRRGVAGVLERLRGVRDEGIAPVRAAMEAIERGDLTAEVPAVETDEPTVARDEIGDLLAEADIMRSTVAETVAAYERTRGSLAEMIARVSGGAATVAGASQQMATVSQDAGRAVGEIGSAVEDVAQGAERQVRVVEQVRRMAEEMAEAGRSGSAAVAETVDAAAQAQAAATEGAEAVSRATQAMQAVRDASHAASDAIGQLSGKSEEIGGIVGTIGQIAEQTNLLALNAAIEAARAGEQGKGFAVVAEEVRKLAEESHQAAQTISGLIAEIQTETARAVEVVGDGATRTDDGARTVEEARESFTRIAERVRDMHDQMDDVATTIARVAEDSERLGSEMAEVTAVAEQSSAATEQVLASTQHTGASTGEIADSAQSLAATAEELDRLVGHFTLAQA
jgi:methyl-accepting chemotaxis protein